ncbi:MAG: HepT-like ribonuclease domain-containing protein [Patescibacteria group bacterium]
MKNLDINKKIILDRISLIKFSISKLEDLKPLSPGRFMLGENFAIAEHYLRYALEATFDICAHILSKIPGVMVSEYKEMAIEMGKKEIIPMNFAENKLYEMAGYRNRLTHFYFEVKSKEMYKIIQNDLGDFNIFLKHIKKLLK